MNPRQIIKDHSYPLLAGLSTLSLIFTSVSLRETSQALKHSSQSLLTISEWAMVQNECIERTFRINGKDTKGVPSKVWSCNGGGN